MSFGAHARARTARFFVLAAALAVLAVTPALAQNTARRIVAPIQDRSRVTLAGSHPPPATAERDAGAVSDATELHGMTLGFSRSAKQEASLKALIAAQQDPKSPQYHHWLTPDTFAARYGVAAADLAAAQTWLESQGFRVDSISRSRTLIRFSGNAGQVASAFGTRLHYYTVDGQKQFAPSSDLSLPGAFAGVVTSVGNLSSFRPRPMHVSPHGAFTSGQTGSHFLTPADVATIYDINPAYSAGYDGTGQSIVIAGQSAVETSDIANFQNAAGLAVKTPTLVIVPDSGSSTAVKDDESESDLDLEYAGGIATGATLYFVYTGSDPNYGVFDSVEYAIDEDLSPIISLSYSVCEADLTATDFSQFDALLEQGASQGQSVLAAAGDQGSTACYGDTSDSTIVQEELAVNFPASSQYVTGIGGTAFSVADTEAGNTTYWNSDGSTDLVNSAKSYIPEIVWNDDSSKYGLSATGGGKSVLEARPSWQSGVPGIPSGSLRLVPDVSLDSSNDEAPYLFCSSDASTGVTGSCSNGFRASDDSTLTAAGGTSFATPIWAGLLAILNQAVRSDGQGLINPTLYSLASNATTYATAFHDVTSGSNACGPSGATFCSSDGESGYSAGTGYDLATGLGSVDFYQLLQAWPSQSSLAYSITSLAASSSAPANGVNDTITMTVGSGSASTSAVPTGTVKLTVNGVAVATALTLSNGSATYTFSSTTAGANTVVAQYSGDSIYAPSTASIVVTVGTGTTTAGSFTVAAANLSISDGSSGSTTVTVTPAGGYTGTVDWAVSVGSELDNACYTIDPVTVSGTSAATTALTIYTSSADCGTTDHKPGIHGARKLTPTGTARANHSSVPPSRTAPAAFALAGLLFAGLLSPRARRIRPLLSLSLLAALSFGVTACGGGSSSSGSTGTNAAKGTYTITLTGTDTATSTITATTTLTLTIN